MTDFNAVKSVSRAVHGLLASSLYVQSALGNPARLYDDPPEDPVFPYLTYGPIRSEDNSAQGAVITNHVLTLHLWSRYSGRAESLALLGTLSNALTREPMELGGESLVNRHIIYTDLFRASDGLTLHGIIRLRITTDRELETL
jgi:hypothetical protein